MNPIFFGSSARQLFGVYEPARNGSRGAAVLCPPLGNEYLFSHATLRLLARMLADGGYHVLRFDYYGSGDSAGEFEHTDHAQWLGDVVTAVEELRDLSGLERVTLIGLRYGATLAAEAARARRDVDRVVMWDPILDGNEYLGEVTSHAALGPGDADGFTMTPRIRADFERIRMESYATASCPTLLIVSAPAIGAYAALHTRVNANGVRTELMHSPAPPAWRNSHPHAAALPVATLKSIVAWLK